MNLTVDLALPPRCILLLAIHLQIVMMKVLYLHGSRSVCVMAAIDARQNQGGAIVHTAAV